MRKFAFLILLLCTIQGGYEAIGQAKGGQSRVVSGTVKNDEGFAIPNASVIVKGTTQGTTTNELGFFTLRVPSTAKSLEVSSTGHQTRLIALTKEDHYDLTLGISNKQLEEVIITGYGTEKKSQFSGAATTISAKTIEDVPVGTLTQALQGRAPGLLANSGSGQPGTNATITIRGVKSIQGAGAAPLYVIDGTPISSGVLETLNPDDFESITILKDAGASALYGSRGATGVIVITTKRGKAGPTKITAKAQYGITKAPDFSRLNLMNTSEILEYEKRLGLAGTNPVLPGWTWSPDNPTYATASAAEKQLRDHLLDSVRNIHTDLPSLFYRDGASQSYNVSMSGGNNKTRFYLSTEYFNQQGIAHGTGMERYSSRFNLGHSTGKLTVDWNTSTSYVISNYSVDEGVNTSLSPFQMTYRARPYDNPYKADGSLNFGPSTSLKLTQVANVLERIQSVYSTGKRLEIHSSLSTGFQILPYLLMKNTFGIDATGDLSQTYVRPDSYSGRNQAFGASYPGYDNEGFSRFSRLINTSSLTFSKKINSVHDIEVAAYWEAIRTYSKSLSFTVYNLDPRLLNTAQGAGALPTNGNPTYPQSATSSHSGTGIRSYFGTARYSFKNKYTINGNIRRDGTSNIFNEDNKEITTWSAGAIWNVINEDFMNKQKVLTDAKLRISYGIVPNIGSIPSRSSQVPAYGTVSYVGSTVTGIYPTSPGNPNLRIEKVKMTNIGVDLAAWKDRIRLSVDAYYNKTVDLFVNQPLSAVTGFGSAPINAGVMTNKGLEFTFNAELIKTKDLSLTFNANHAININNIENLGLVSEYELGTFIIRVGLPYGSHYNVHYLGADPQTGRPLYETPDHGTTMVLAQAGKFANYGTYLPKHVGGFGPTIRYKGLSVEAFFSYQFDVTRSNNIRNWITRGTSGYQSAVNGSRELLTKQWRKPGDQAFFQAPNYDRDFTSADLEDAKFLRFRNLNVSYQLPKFKVAGYTPFQNASVYFQMQNVTVWSKWTGSDPEDNNNISLNEYPNPKMIVFGLILNL